MNESIYSLPNAARPWTLRELASDWDIRYFSYARRALARGLEAAGVAAGDAVLFPAFICRDLLSAAAAVGARPVFYALTPALTPEQAPDVWPKAKGVIAVNYFGFPQDLSPFYTYARDQNAILIEDNAHGLFSRDESGTLLGLRGDLGLFSLRKTLALANGAALVSPASDARDLGDQDPFAAPPGKAALKSLFRSASKITGPRASLALLNLLRSLMPAPAPGADDETVLPDPAFPDAALAAPLTVADETAERERRRALYAAAEEQLRPAGFTPLFPSLPPKTVPYAFAFRCPPHKTAAAQRALAPAGLRSLPWPDLPDAVHRDAPEYYRDVRLVHFLW